LSVKRRIQNFSQETQIHNFSTLLLFLSKMDVSMTQLLGT
jgi:hypothetical protein